MNKLHYIWICPLAAIIAWGVVTVFIFIVQGLCQIWSMWLEDIGDGWRRTRRTLKERYRNRKKPDPNGPQLLEARVNANGNTDMVLKHPMFAKMAEAVAEIMRKTGGENFITMNMCDGKHMYELTCRKADGKTPADRINELEQTIKQMHKDYGCEVRDPNGTIWDHAAKLQELVQRYRRETPLGHQPHMIAGEVDKLLGEP